MDEILIFLRDSPGHWGLAVVFAAAAVEYLAPPLPADTVVLAGSLLVVAGSSSFGVVLLAVVAGGTLGSTVQYVLGRTLADPESGTLRGGKWLGRLFGEEAQRRVLAAVKTHGLRVIAINRMLPGIRAGAFLVAGAARLPAPATLALGFLSNLAWAVLLLGVGTVVGGNFEKLQRWLSVYQTVAGTLVLALVAVGYFVYRNKVRERNEG